MYGVNDVCYKRENCPIWQHSYPLDPIVRLKMGQNANKKNILCTADECCLSLDCGKL